MAETDGQASPAPETTSTTGTQTSTAAPESVSTSQPTSSPAPAQTDELIYDPELIRGKPELEALAKQLQASYTKKSQEIAQHRQKIQAFDDFASNPAQALQQLATQFGYTLTRAQAQQMVNEQKQQQQFEPQSWDDVINKAKAESRQEVLKELEPFLNNVKETRKGQLEKLLDDNCPDWRVYEDDMMKTLKNHPTLVNDPEKLYRMSVPASVLESRATQAALRKLQTKVESSQLSSGSSTNQTADSKPKGKMTFNQSVEYAKAKLAASGIKPPN